LLIENEPVACEPTVWAAPLATMHATVVLLLAPTVNVPLVVPARGVPLSLRLQAVTATFDVPMFLSVTRQAGPLALLVWAQRMTDPETCAELVNDPNRPNTNPAMAMAAMRVMAMSMTVANTGEIAFLFRLLLILKAGYLFKTRRLRMALMRRC